MADVMITGGGNTRKLVKFDEVAAALTFQLDFSGASNANLQCMTDGGEAVATASADMDQLFLKADIDNAYTVSGLSFTRSGVRTVAKGSGELHANPSPVTGLGTVVGNVTPAAGQVMIDQWAAGSSPVVTDFRGGAGAPVDGPFTPYGGYEVMFRTAAAPLRSGSLSVLATMADGTPINVTANTSGHINATRVKGVVDYETGVVDLFFVTPSAAEGQATVDLSFLGIPGVSNVYLDRVRIDTIRYNAVAFAYLPLDASILGIDPVRLPTDGRVPIFRPGTLMVFGHTDYTDEMTVADDDEIDIGRERLSRVTVLDANDQPIYNGYTVDLNTGILTVEDSAAWDQPIKIRHRIEDMVQCRDAQISGDLSFVPALSHHYPEGSFISSALVAQDLTARVSLLFDQATWNGVNFSDVPGDAAGGTYNDTAYPIEVTNAGSETERWAIHFQTNTTVRVVGEHVGVILINAPIGVDIAPINPVTGEPYFRIRNEGWGAGWAVGNILRINIVGARFTYWAVRTVKQGPETGVDYSTHFITRGDVDNPLP